MSIQVFDGDGVDRAVHDEEFVLVYEVLVSDGPLTTALLYLQARSVADGTVIWSRERTTAAGFASMEDAEIWMRATWKDAIVRRQFRVERRYGHPSL